MKNLQVLLDINTTKNLARSKRLQDQKQVTISDLKNQKRQRNRLQFLKFVEKHCSSLAYSNISQQTFSVLHDYMDGLNEEVFEFYIHKPLEAEYLQTYLDFRVAFLEHFQYEFDRQFFGQIFKRLKVHSLGLQDVPEFRIPRFSSKVVEQSAYDAGDYDYSAPPIELPNQINGFCFERKQDFDDQFKVSKHIIQKPPQDSQQEVQRAANYLFKRQQLIEKQKISRPKSQTISKSTTKMSISSEDRKLITQILQWSEVHKQSCHCQPQVSKYQQFTKNILDMSKVELVNVEDDMQKMKHIQQIFSKIDQMMKDD